MHVPSRRSVLSAGAWSAPAVLLASASPAFASSPPAPTELVHQLALRAGGAPLSQVVTSPHQGVFQVAGSVTNHGGMEGISSPDDSFVVGHSATLGGNAAWLYQQRARIADWSRTYEARREYTITVNPRGGLVPRDLEVTVGRVNASWVGSSTNRTMAVIGAVRAVTPGVVVTSYGSNLRLVAASGGVPEHYVASTSASANLDDASTCITFRRPGNVTSITFEVWNKADRTGTGTERQTLHLGGISVVTDV